MSKKSLRERLEILPEQSRRELLAFIETSTPSSVSEKSLQDTLQLSAMMHRSLAEVPSH
jgi:hypothetical protein